MKYCGHSHRQSPGIHPLGRPLGSQPRHLQIRKENFVAPILYSKLLFITLLKHVSEDDRLLQLERQFVVITMNGRVQ